MGDVIQLRRKSASTPSRATYDNPVTPIKPRPAYVNALGEMVTQYEFANRSQRDAFVRMTPGSWSGYKVTPDGYTWYAYVVEG